MPRSTNMYPFENKVWDGLANLAFQLTGKSGEGNGIKVVLNARGCLLSLFSQREFSDFRDRGEGAEATLFYDPFEGPVYQFIGWSNVSPDTLERVLNVKFSPEDLISFGGDRLDKIPASHSVMF